MDEFTWPPERAGREGDSQPMPIAHSDRPDIQSLVIADIEERRQLGIRRYGTPLQAHNGRDALVDAYEEALDLAMYLKQRITEAHAEDWNACYVDMLERVIEDCSPVHHRHLKDLAVEATNRRVGHGR